jgi:hypothetical protein
MSFFYHHFKSSMPRFLGSFCQTFGFGFKSRGLRDTCHHRPIFQIYLEYKDRRFMTYLTLSLILRLNLRLGGYSIWSAIFIAPHIKDCFWRLNRYSGHEHLIASMQPGKYSKDTFKMEFQKNSKTPSEVLGSLQYSATKSSEACQTRGDGTAHKA